MRQFFHVTMETLRAQVDGSMPRDVNRGINSVRRLVRQHGITGVHGTLIELISCQPQLYTAVEVGSSCARSHVRLYLCTWQTRMLPPALVLLGH
jgi:hypothetical protein